MGEVAAAHRGGMLRGREAAFQVSLVVICVLGQRRVSQPPEWAPWHSQFLLLFVDFDVSEKHLVSLWSSSAGAGFSGNCSRANTVLRRRVC